MDTTVVFTRSVGKLVSGEQAVRFNDRTLAMHPLWLDRVQPGALRGQQTQDNSHARLALFDPLVVFPEPGPDGLADVPGRVIPDQQQGGLSRGVQLLATPVQEVRADGADWTSIHKAEQHLIGRLAVVAQPHASQQSIAGQCLGIRIVLGTGLFDQAHRGVVGLPGVQVRCGQPAPPDLVAEAQHPGRVRLGKPNQAVTTLFLGV